MPAEEPNEAMGEYDALRITFGQAEARLARMHDIASDKRTQFQARLRNFQKLKIPAGVKAGRGKTVLYTPGQLAEMALALELAQVGLLPERIAEVFRLNKHPIASAVALAAQALLQSGGFPADPARSDANMPRNTGSWWATGREEEDPVSMFIYFDPTALASLTDVSLKHEDQASATFFYGGARLVRENIVRWTAGPHIRRLSLINVTAMIWGLIVRSKPKNQTLFLRELEQWAKALEEQRFAETLQEGLEEGTSQFVFIDSYADVVRHADVIRRLKGLPPQVAEAMIERARQMIKDGKEEIPEDAGLLGKPSAEMTATDVEDEIVAQAGMAGLPEYVMRAAIEHSKRAKEARRKKRDSNSEGVDDGDDQKA